MDKKISKSLQFVKQLNTMLNAQMTAWIVSTEEEKFLKLFRKIAEAQYEEENPNFGIYSWSITEGLLNVTSSMIKENNVYKKPTKVENVKNTKTKESVPVLSISELYDYIMNNSYEKIFILKDLHNFLDKSRQDYVINVRRLKDIIFHARINKSKIIFFSPINRVPLDLETDIQVLNMPRPDEYDIENILNVALNDISSIKPDIVFDIDYINNKNKLVKSKHPQSKQLKEKLIMNLRGLTESEISQIIAFTCVKNKALNEEAINEIKNSKKQIIEKNGVLNFIPNNHLEIGGHNNFKEYIDNQALYLDKDIREKYSLSTPKGVLLVGISGCGKSKLANYIGYKWNIPLIRFNMDAVFNKFLGESEDNLRTALSIAEATSPCIVFLDEIEKSLGGLSGSGDSGTGMRILGKILTWMQEKQEMVYLVATANDVSKLPPELLRAGRLDAKFWADLPSEAECKEIFYIKSKENNFSLENEEYDYLSKLAYEKQFTGAEIEHAIKQSLYLAAKYKNQKNTYKNIYKAMKEITPHAEIHKEELKKSREIALKNYIFTSEEVKQNLINKT